MRNKQQGGNISFGHCYLLSKSSEEQWECQGLVCSWLPPKHLSSLPLFLIRAPSWVFLLSPQGATLGCDKSASAPQVTNQHSPGKNNSEAQTTKGSENPEGSAASRKNGLRKKKRAVNHPYLPGFAGLAFGQIISKPLAHKLFSLRKGDLIDKEETRRHPWAAFD